MAKNKKTKELVAWTLDADFYSYAVTVKARTKGEARRKAMLKLSKVPLTKFLNKNTTSLEKEY